MNSWDQDTASPRRPTMGYYLALAAALVGFVCLVIAVEGTRRALAGGDGLSALSGAGVPGLVIAWAVAFYARLAFSKKLSSSSQAFVHGSLRVFMVIEIITTIFASWFVLSNSTKSGDLRGILVVADILQIGTVFWVLRFYRE